MQSTLTRILAIFVIWQTSLSLQAQQFTITSDKESGSCGNQHVSFEAGFIEVGTTYSFDSGRMPDDWSSSPYNLGQACSGIFSDTPDNSDYFWATINDSNGQRFVATNDLNVKIGGQITFSMRFGRDDPSSGCENPDEPSEGVYLQYSTDGGLHWSTIKYWVPYQIGTLSPEGVDLYSWTQFSVVIPEEAKTTSTRFRWFQPSNSGSSYDNWGMDDISVLVLKEAQSYQWDIGDGQIYEAQALKTLFEVEGPKNISCTVTDTEGAIYSSAITYDVVIDEEAPEASTKDYFLILDEDGQAELIADYLDGGSSDNCGELTYSVDKTTFTCDDLGENTVTLTVSDNAGNSSSAAAKVTIYDFTAPQVITKDITIQLDKEGKASVSAEQIDGGSIDACSGRLTLNLSKSEFGIKDLGENSVTLTATDESGNQGRATAIVTVVDITAPEGYAVSFDESVVNLENQTTLNFTIERAEPGSIYEYSIQTSNGATLVSGIDSIKTTTQKVSAVDVSSLADGKLILSLSLTDASGNTGEVTTDEIYKDCSRPTVSITTSEHDPVKEAFIVNIHFSEAVSDFTTHDLVLENATASELQLKSAQHYSLSIQPNSDGLVSLEIADGVVIDAASNPNLASELLSKTYDSTAPEVSLSASANVFNAAFNINIDFSEVVTDFSAEDISVSNGTVAQLQTDNNQNFVAQIVAEQDGEVTIAIAGAVTQDVAGNVNLPSSESLILLYDATPQKTIVDIVSVESVPSIQVPFATSIASVEFPETVTVNCSDKTQKSFEVSWITDDFNTHEAGTYTIEGQLILEGCTNTQNIKAQLELEVAPNRAPTLIILSANTFSPVITQDEAIASLTTQDTDDDVHQYALVEGEGATDNDLFVILGNELFLSSDNGLSGQKSFSIRVQSADAYSNTIEAVFTLSKTPYEQTEPINFVNTFSPNADGINELWLVPDLKFFDDVLIEVYDRSGRRIFQTTDPEQGWDGSNNGSIQKGSYYYIITINDIQLSKRGVLSVIK
ncbi:Ig-like domain-containing protein [Catalinimonas sp. 4WD22]|uniref:Ig-like domain-containing protein n=1 Tax=Catalinimonas locisalis TaxID=3133978 RepID=UPI003100F655